MVKAGTMIICITRRTFMYYRSPSLGMTVLYGVMDGPQK